MSDNGPQFPSKEFEAFEKPVLLQPDHVKSMLFTEKWNDRANGPSSKTVHEEVRWGTTWSILGDVNLQSYMYTTL